MKNQQKYRLGLDMGTNSLGWAIIGLDDRNEPNAVIHAGVRIFTDGRKKGKGGGSTLKAVRRTARLARRNRDHNHFRTDKLLRKLKKIGLFPTSDEAAKALQKINPWQLRAEALERRLEPHQIGRALFHINQRRGFKSNRKVLTDDKETSAMLESIEDMRKKLKLSGKTLGAFLYERNKEQQPVRARRQGEGKSNKDKYDFYPDRSMLEEEFNLIWKTQAEYHPQLLTEKLQKCIHDIIFRQRPLQPQEPGNCIYIPKEKCIPKAMATFQRYCIYQKVNYLSWYTKHKKHFLIEHPEARDDVVALMEKPRNKKGTITFDQIRTILKKRDIMDIDVNFNYEEEKSKTLQGNQVSKIMQDSSRVGKNWHTWSLEKQDQFIGILLDDTLSDEKVVEKLQKEYSLTEEQARCCVRTSLPDGYANFSQKAARYLVTIMQEELYNQAHAVQKAAEKYDEFENPGKGKPQGELLPKLPYYVEAIRGHVVPGKPNEKSIEKRLGTISNPTVHIALNQIRRVINELISIYGHPYSIAVELSRELPMGKKRRAELEEKQDNNKKTNDRLAEIIDGQGEKVTKPKMLRVRLWEELGKSCSDRFCPYTGKLIRLNDLFNGNTAIEHILPKSISMDDSRANLTICFQKANHDKGNQTPYEAFGHSPPGYSWPDIHHRAQQLHPSKRWRFQQDARERLAEEENFLARHLNDNRYVSKLTREYLESICSDNKIDVLTGGLTDLLRRYWRLHNIYSDKTEHEKKNRDDHRHHAVDAITVGMTTLSLLQKLYKAAKEEEEKDIKSIDFRGVINEPWKKFRIDVKNVIQNIIVSHRPTRTKQGQLHNDTAYGLPILKTEKEPNFEKALQVVTRKTIRNSKNFKKKSDFQKIRSVRLRNKLLELFEQGGKEAVYQYAQKKRIRRLRIIDKISIIPIRDQSGTVYKGYKPDSNWAMEIYQHPETAKWIGVVISRFEANQKDFQPGVSKRPHPTAPLIMRLHRNDYVLITHNGEKKLMRIQKLVSGEVYLIPPHEANVDTRTKEKTLQYTRPNASGLQKKEAQKVHISPTGRISYGH